MSLHEAVVLTYRSNLHQCLITLMCHFYVCNCNTLFHVIVKVVDFTTILNKLTEAH